MYTLCEYMGLVCTGENFYFPHETESTLRGRHLHWLAAVLNIRIHRYTAFHPPPQHFFFIHTYNEELQKTSQIKVPYFILNMFFFFFFFKTKRSCNLGISCCTDPAHRHSPTPDRPPCAQRLQAAQRPRRPLTPAGWVQTRPSLKTP